MMFRSSPLAVLVNSSVITGEVQPSVIWKAVIEGKKLMDVLLALFHSGPSSTKEGYTTPS